MSTNRLPQASESTMRSTTQADIKKDVPFVRGSQQLVRPVPVTGHLTARGRRLVSLLIALPVVALSLFVGGQVAHAMGNGAKTTEIVVKTGESLWDVANKVAPNSDPREVIWTIQQLNHMKTSAILDGQTLIVPNLSN